MPDHLPTLSLIVCLCGVLASQASASSLSRLPGTSCIIVHCETSNQTVRIDAWGEDAVRVRAAPEGAPMEEDGVSALVHKFDGEEDDGRCEEVVVRRGEDLQAAPVWMSSGNMNATILPDGRLEFSRVHDGRVLLAEDNTRSFAAPTHPSTRGFTGFFSLTLQFSSTESERLYGLGQHKTGDLDNKGHIFTLQPDNTEILIPVLHSSSGYSFLQNVPAYGTFNSSAERTEWRLEAVRYMDVWVGTTPKPSASNAAFKRSTDTEEGAGTAPVDWATLLSRYAHATGLSPEYPAWATGFWQSKNRYRNQSQLLDVARQHVTRGIPLSLIVIDYFNWRGSPLGDEVLPKQCWPDPKAMVDELKAIGVELLLSPYFHSLQPSSKNYPEAVRQRLLAVNTSGAAVEAGYDGTYIYDIYQPGARRFMAEKVTDGYIAPYGINHWWLDCDEPCGSNDVYNLVYRNGTWPAAFVGAAYPHVLGKAVSEELAVKGDESPVVMLGRSAWAGSQRFGHAVWSGDIESTFDSLQQQFRAGLNVAMSGIAYWTTDIGGYGGANITTPYFRELIVRWFQFGAFCPLFRLHGSRHGGPVDPRTDECGSTGASNEIWNFGEEAYKAIRVVMGIRAQLRPYIQSLYQENAKTGAPIIRPLFYDFPEDEVAASVDDQLMFGPSYLLAPQLFQGKTSRSVVLPELPAHELWVSWFDPSAVHNTTSGAVVIDEPTPLDTFPLFERVCVG